MAWSGWSCRGAVNWSGTNGRWELQQDRVDGTQGTTHASPTHPSRPHPPTLVKPYSVSATKPMGMVLITTPAMGMKPQMKTKREKRPIPGMARAHMPRQVRMVFTSAMRDCSRGQSMGGRLEAARWAQRGVDEGTPCLAGQDGGAQRDAGLHAQAAQREPAWGTGEGQLSG